MTNPDKLAEKFAKRFEKYNTKVLKELAKVIKQFKGLNYTQASQLAQQLKFDRSYIDLVDELAKLTNITNKDIEKVLEDTVKEHTEFSDVFFKAKNINTPIYEEDLYLQELVKSVAKASEGDFTNIARSTGFAFLDKNNHIQFLNMKDTYYKLIDDSVYAISEGKELYNESIRKIIKQLSESGVRRIVYANSGKRVYTQRIDTAVRRNIKDSIRQVSIETELEFGKRFNSDGVEIISHENPAPDHMNVQGHQFSKEEFNKFQNDLDCYSYDGEFFPAESIETGRDRRSIGEYNCYHEVKSILLGVTKPRYTKEQLQEIKDRANEIIQIDGKDYTRYQATQLQRQIETEIRKSKDALMMYKENDNREGMEEEQLKITRLTRKYKEISKKAELVDQLKDRASVSGYRPIKVKGLRSSKLNEDKKDIAKTSKIYKNYDDNEAEFKLNNPNIVLKERNKIIDEWTDDAGGFHTNTGIMKYLTEDRELYGIHKGWEQGVKDIEDLIKGTTDEDILVFRTIQIPVNELKVGQIVDKEGFIASSITRSKSNSAFNYGDAYSTTIDVEVDKGTRSLYIGDKTASKNNENEILFSKDYAIIIKDIKKEYDKDGDYLRTVVKGKLIKKKKIII